MLWFIGLGISGISELSDSTLDVIKNAEIVYLESFTSPISETEKKQLEDISNGEFKTAKRWLVEDGNEILDNAKNKETVLISYGDPYIATTHLELKTRAMRDGHRDKNNSFIFNCFIINWRSRITLLQSWKGTDHHE